MRATIRQTCDWMETPPLLADVSNALLFTSIKFPVLHESSSCLRQRQATNLEMHAWEPRTHPQAAMPCNTIPPLLALGCFSILSFRVSGDTVGQVRLEQSCCGVWGGPPHPRHRYMCSCVSSWWALACELFTSVH